MLFSPQILSNRPKRTSSYQGPGDVVATWAAFGSTARAYTAAFAASGGAMFDIVDSGGINQATINCLTTGFVDLTTLNAWIVSHGTASVKKLYDQTGNGNHWTNATLSQMPTITQSALNGLPGMTFVGANNSNLATGATFTLAQPYSMAAVYQRSSGTNAGGILSTNGASPAMTAGNGAANRVDLTAGTITALSGVNDAAFHAAQAIFNGASPNSIMAADGASNTGSSGAGAFSSSVLRVGRAALTLDGIIMEVGIWSGAWDATQYGNINSNAHDATSGYNF